MFYIRLCITVLMKNSARLNFHYHAEIIVLTYCGTCHHIPLCLSNTCHHIDGLMQKKGNSIASALQFRLLCAKPSILALCTTRSHYNDVIMDPIASQITSLTIAYSVVYSDADQRKHQSSASLAFVRGIHRGPVNSPHKWPVTRKMFPFDDVIMPLMCSVHRSKWNHSPSLVTPDPATDNAWASIYMWNLLWRHQKEIFPRYRPFVRGIHRAPVNSPHKGPWRGALMFSLICAWKTS